MNARTKTMLTAVAATCLMASSGCTPAPKVDNLSPSRSTDALIFEAGIIRDVRLTPDKVRLLREAEVILYGVDGTAQPNTAVVASEIDGLIRSREKADAVWRLINGRNILKASIDLAQYQGARSGFREALYCNSACRHCPWVHKRTSKG